MLTDQQRIRLVQAARAATARAFLTGPGGTAYGAAVLSLSGHFSSAGQYSSWNHITNIHAEQAVLLLAAMSDDADVLALALACTGDEPVARPCGVCRQVMKEHAERTGRDFEVLMAHRYDSGFDRSMVTELLPLAWNAQSKIGVPLPSPTEVSYRQADLRPARSLDGQPVTGDHVVLTDQSISMVWDGCFEGDLSLVKIKYAPPGKCGRRKVAHSFTEALRYQAELHELGWARQTRIGALACTVRSGDIRAWLPAIPLGELDESVPGPLLGVLSCAEIDSATVRVSGSRSLGLQHQGSDWDLVVPVSIEQLQRLRKTLVDAVGDGELRIPATSGTWRLLDRLFPGGQAALLSEKRFVDTIGSGGASVALILVPQEPLKPLFDDTWEQHGREALHGTVVDASQAAYKRAFYHFEADQYGVVEAICYHKMANLLQVGDQISVRGWLLRRGNTTRLVQMLPVPDNIVWFRKGK